MTPSRLRYRILSTPSIRYYIIRASLFFCVEIALIVCCMAVSKAQVHTLETKDLRLLYYGQEQATVIPHLERCFENSMTFHRNLFHYTPSEKVTVFLQDFDDYGYAGAAANPFNYLVLGIEPYEQVYETTPTNERFNWVMSHELMHIVTTDKASSGDKLYRNIFFGKVAPTSENPISMFYSYLTSPRKYTPRWYLEGIAVFMETWMAGGIGRAQGGYDEMVFRTMACDSSDFFDVVGLESEGTTTDFQIGQISYLYGTRFMSFLAYRYGVDKLLAWVDRTDTSNRDFASQFQRIYGKPLDEKWNQWIDWERRWQRENLDSIRRFPLTQYQYISREPLGSVSRTFYDSATGKLYAAVNYPGQLAHIVSIDARTGEIHRLCKVPSPGLYYVCSLAYDRADGILFYTLNNNRSWRTLNSLDLKTGETTSLIENCRIGDLAFNAADKSLWGVQHHNGLSILVRLEQPYQTWTEVKRMSYGKDIFDLDVSPDGKSLIAATMDISGRQKLVRLSVSDLLAGQFESDSLYEFENNLPLNFVYSPDGRYAYGTTFLTGVSNVVRYDFERKKMEWLTNIETGFFRPIPIVHDSLMVYRYTGRGFVPVMIAGHPQEDVSAVRYLGYEISKKYPVVRSWTLPSPLTINLDSLGTTQDEYNGFRSLRVVSAYPVVEGFKNAPAYGLRVNLLDDLLANDADFTASYSPNKGLEADQRFHFDMNYRFWKWKLSANYNRADFYDLFGPTKTSRKGYSLGLKYDDYLIYGNPKMLEFTAGVVGWGGLERLPDYQNVSASYERLLAGDVRLSYRNLARSLGGVEAEQGVRGQFALSDNYVNSQNFPRAYATGDYGFLLPLDHSSIWFRGGLGYSIGDRDNPFANFYFGGFGNNWVDYQNVKRYREYSSFPGAQIDEIGGTNFGKLMVEWVLPPLRFRRLGFANLYCTWAHATLFSSSIVTNLDSEPDRQSVAGAGGQIDFKLVLMSRLEATFSVGYAVACERNQKSEKEIMLSLKIM